MSRPSEDDGAAPASPQPDAPQSDSAQSDSVQSDAAHADGGAGAWDDNELLLEDDRPRRHPRLRRVLIVLLASGLILALMAGGFVWYITDRYGGNVTRLPDVFSSLDEDERPAPPTPVEGTDDVPMTFLLAGSDSRADGATTGEDATDDGGSERSDVLMLLQVSADRRSAFAISIPRDSYVPVPGYGTTKINAAFAYGGPTLAVQTVEQLTNIRIDHFLAVDFNGFKAITDALGGVDVRVAEETHAFGVTFTQGVNHLDGDKALAYVRQRYRLPGGDFDRVQRQQSYLRAVMATVSRDNLLTDPGRLDDFVLAVTGSMSVDDELSNIDLASLALSLRNLQPDNVAFLTVPVAGTGMEGTQSVVYIDMPPAEAMWSYILAGNLAEHLGEFNQLPAVPR